MTAAPPVFELTYWGVMGTMASPLLPSTLQEKLVESMCLLLETGCLDDLHSQNPIPRDAVARMVNEKLPFHLRSTYGGNTTCIEVNTPDGLLIFDCGSGFRELGYSLMERWSRMGAAAKRSANILISHAHMDHTYGTPFFLPYYESGCTFDVYALQVVLDSLTAVLSPDSALSRLYFPPTYSEMKSEINFHPVVGGNEWSFGSTNVRSYALNHPGGALAFRIENAGRVIVIATDHEHLEVPDPGLAEFARGADLLYTDGQYLQTEYEGTRGVGKDPAFPRKRWGHSPVEACVKTGVAAEVGILHVGHRDPRRNDPQVADFEKYLLELTAEELKKTNRPPGACHAAVPYEGMRITM
jgi:phosphoribosyl 1,2-cyclic phosphodiesterase